MVRVKQRYLLFSILYPDGTSSLPSQGSGSTPVPKAMTFCQPSPANLNRTTLGAVIRNSISHNFGDWGMGQAGGFAVKYFSQATSTGILRITRDNYRILWAALTFIRELYGQPVVIRVVRVSGTIRKAELEAVKLAEETIRRVKREQKEAGSAGKGVAATFANTTANSKEAAGKDIIDLDYDEGDIAMDMIDSDQDSDMGGN